jgi:hypothetical protein
LFALCPTAGPPPRADAVVGSPRGTTEAVMMAHGFSIVELVTHGLATAHAQRMRTGKKIIDVACVRITDSGRQALLGN